MVKSKLKSIEIQQIFQRFHSANPHPKVELNSVNEFTFLVAVVLSAQATDAGVNKATAKLFAVADTPKKMLALGIERLESYIRTVGLYRTKARNIILLSRQLVEAGSVIPRNRNALEALPGVGQKTANVVLNQLFGEPTIAVDTHVFRVSNRTGLAPGTSPSTVEATLTKIVPDHFKTNAHQWLILHGRYICRAVRPRCNVCLIRDICKYRSKMKDIV